VQPKLDLFDRVPELRKWASKDTARTAGLMKEWKAREGQGSVQKELLDKGSSEFQEMNEQENSLSMEGSGEKPLDEN
jgi:hypothetical protein